MPPSASQIGPGTHVRLTYVAFDEDGEVVDAAESGEPLDYIHGYGQIVPGLERALEGMVAGQSREVVLEPSEAYGDHDPEGVFEVDKSDFPDPDEVELDEEFVAEGPDGSQVVMRVVDVLEEGFLVDCNHPLAGVKLRYQVKVEGVRDATSEELEQAERELEAADGCGCGEDHDHDHAHGEGEAGGGELIQLRTKGKNDGPS